VIPLSWLNKFLKMFQEKDEYHDRERSMVEYHQEIKTDKKELETRVTYYYPKGEMPSPLFIKEEKKSPQSKRIRPKREPRKESAEKEYGLPLISFSQEKRERKNRKHEKKLNQPELVLPEKKHEDHILPPSKNEEQLDQLLQFAPITQKQKIETREKVTKKSSRPFRPTEIPSPIYGFTKRPQQSEIVEFELTSDEKLLEIQQRIVSMSSQEQAAATIQLEEDVAPSTKWLEEVFEDKEIEDIDSEIGESEYEQEVSIHELIEEETEEIIELIDGEEVEQTSVFTCDLPEVNKEEVIEETSIPLEIDIVKLVNEKPPHLESEIEPHNEVNETENKPTQRSHLPFNVLMLNQDKRKWEQKRIERAVQQEILTPVLDEKVVRMDEAEITNPLVNDYIFPKMDLLNPPMTRFAQENMDWIDNQEHLLNEALKNFGVRASVVNITQGPSVTRFEVQPEPGVKVNKITNLSDDIKLSLAAKDIRIEAPIPGKHTIGIEVPNKKSRPVLISEIIRTESFQNSASPLTAVLGLDISGAPVVTDLKKMPHGLIAGATGSGKSVCINSILISLLYKANPNELKLLLIDPKMVELAPYNHIPHLVSPVITDVKAATAALKWAVDEMERRYELFAHTGVRDINRFNEIAEQHKRYADKLPFIVIIIDELADLMMMSPADVEESICRIAQKARACGIHLIIATQRPSVDVITGLIKANVPTRTAFSVSSQIDSRTIIDISGAEKLLGRGDMLFLENGSSKPVRLQGTFVSDAEIDLVVEHVRKQQEPQYLFHQEELLKRAQVIEDEDELFYEACEFVIEQGGASTSSVQRRFKIGYNRAARLIDMMEQQGFISEPKGSKPRDVLITEEALEQIQENTSSSFL
jgi:DNA segregation ATPase FtsK/SpoIIIE, S-DNA-T family